MTLNPAPIAAPIEKKRYGSIVYVILSMLFMLAFLLGAVILVGMVVMQSLVNLPGVPALADPMPDLLLAAALAACGLALVPVTIQVFRAWQGKPDAPASLPVLPLLPLVALICLWGMAAAIAQFTELGSSVFALPILAVLGLSLPIYLLVRIGSGGLIVSSRQRTWRVFGIGLVGGPLVAGFVELLGYLFLVLAFTLFFVLRPDLQQTVSQVSELLKENGDLEQALVSLAPLLQKPVVIILLLMVMSVFIPIVEELVKPLGIWLLRKQPPSPTEGFVLGVVSGAGFALLEGLLAVSSNAGDWGVAFIARIGGGIMHIFNTGLMGWAIARFYQDHKRKNLVRILLLVILLHGLWNGLTIGTVIGGLNALTAPAGADLLGSVLVAVFFSLLGLLGLGVLVALILTNRRMRRLAAPAPAPSAPLPVDDHAAPPPPAGS